MQDSDDLARSMDDKELLLLGRLKALQDRFELILKLTANPHIARKLPTLLRIHEIAEEALTL